MWYNVGVNLPRKRRVHCMFRFSIHQNIYHFFLIMQYHKNLWWTFSVIFRDKCFQLYVMYHWTKNWRLQVLDFASKGAEVGHSFPNKSRWLGVTIYWKPFFNLFHLFLCLVSSIMRLWDDLFQMGAILQSTCLATGHLSKTVISA